jgi:hypothetical protein
MSQCGFRNSGIGDADQKICEWMENHSTKRPRTCCIVRGPPKRPVQSDALSRNTLHCGLLCRRDNPDVPLFCFVNCLSPLSYNHGKVRCCCMKWGSVAALFLSDHSSPSLFHLSGFFVAFYFPYNAVEVRPEKPKIASPPLVKFAHD